MRIHNQIIFSSKQSLVNYTNLLLSEMEAIKEQPEEKERFTKLFIDLNRVSNKFNSIYKQPFKEKLNSQLRV